MGPTNKVRTIYGTLIGLPAKSGKRIDKMVVGRREEDDDVGPVPLGRLILHVNCPLELGSQRIVKQGCIATGSKRFCSNDNHNRRRNQRQWGGRFCLVGRHKVVVEEA